ncbi:MAG: DUF421 domain-containing protein [Clostridia bacterium]|nr:DUF421 domain-containing protein [Clostridia bacterium]
MTAILIRTVLAYIILLGIVRLMGKRQIGELQMTEFISAILLSEIASLPLTDRDIPLLYGIVPLCVIGSFEVILALLCRRFAPFRHFLEGKPIELVKNGVYLEQNLTKTRISREEIDAQIRINGFASIREVDTVTLEQTGKMSVLPKSTDSNPQQSS